MATIELRSVSKHYGAGTARVAAVRALDLRVGDGEFVVIVGPSGCGKSTLLRMVAGLEAIDEGEIAIGGQVVNRLEPALRDVAMVFQNYALYPHMSVFDNMAYGLRIRRLPTAEIRERVERAARSLGLEALLGRKPGQLSGGQRQRVAMGRAIVREPRAFLFDEPLSNLDARLRAETRLEIQRLHRELGTTALFVTHDQVEAMTLAQRIVVMNAGRIEQVGTPREVYGRPASAFVAGFIGSPAMNLLDGAVRGGVFEAGGARLPLPADARLPDGPILLGVRPEHLAAVGEGGLALRVDAVELLGAERLVHGRLDAQRLVVRQPADAAPAPAVGEVLRLGFAARDLHAFDATSGQRLDAGG